MEALGILAVIGSVTKVAKSLHEIKDRYSNVALNTTLVASQLNVIAAALNALNEWRVNDPDQTAPAQQLDKDLGVSLSCCAILVSVIEGKLGESGYTSGVKGKIRHLWLENILKEYISNLESQIRALQLLLTIYQCSSAAEQRQKLERADSRKIIEDVRAETATLGVESLDIEDRASVYSDNPSVTFDVDSILMKTRAYQKVYEDVKRKPLPEVSQPPDKQKREKPPIPPRLPARPGTKSQKPPVPPRPPPRRRGGAKTTEESTNREEVDKSTERDSIEPDRTDKALNPSQGFEEVKENEVKDLENGIRHEQSTQRPKSESVSSHNKIKPKIILVREAAGKQDLEDSTYIQAEDTVHSRKSPEESKLISSDQENHFDSTNQTSISSPKQLNIKCICGTGDDDGKLTHCEICNTWQHAECYYIDEFGIVPTKQDLMCIDHFCAECAPRALHVEEAVQRKRSKQSKANDISKNLALAAEPQLEAVKLEMKEIPSEFDFGDRVASTAVGEFTSEMENALRGVQYLPPTPKPVNINPDLVEPPIDSNLDDSQENSRETTKLPSPIDKSMSNENDNGPGNEVLETEASPSRKSQDIRTDEVVAEHTALEDKSSTEVIFDKLSDANLPSPSMKSVDDVCEQPSQEQGKPESPIVSKLAPSLTITSHTEVQDSKLNEGSTSPPTSAEVPAASSNSSSAIPKDEEDCLDKLISRIRSSRVVTEAATNANAPSAEDTKTQPKLIPTPPLGFDSGSAILASGSPIKVDTGQHGRSSFERNSIMISTSPPPHPPPPLPLTTQSTSKPALVESVISTESSARTSSVFDAASTVSSEFPEANTLLTNQSAPTDVTSLSIAGTQTSRVRAQSDLRKLQSELVAAKERGDSKAREESIQKSIQVIWDTYLAPPSEDAASPKKSLSPRLGSRASFLRIPSLSGSTKSRVALGNAISEDDEASIRRLLAEKANVNGRAEGGETPLMLAATLGHLTSMRILKEYGADECASDAKGRTALHLAVAYNQVSAVKWLLEAYTPAPKAPPERTSKLFRAADLARGSRTPKILREIRDAEGSTALHVAAERGMGGMLKVLLTAGVDIEAKDTLGRTPLLRAVLSQKRASFDMLLQNSADIHAVDSKDTSALHFAAASDQVDIIKMLLSKGIDRQAFDHDGTQALHHAGRNGKISAITTLVTSQSDLNTPTKTGDRLLHLASAHNHLPLAEHLLTSNVDVNPFATPSATTIRSLRPIGTQLTPLHYACVLGHLEMSILLLKHMAWVNAPTDIGMTALMMAADNEDTNLVNVLLEAGAKVNASVPGSCLTALHIAARKGDLETVQQLCRAGANESATTSGSNGRNPIEEALKYLDGDKKTEVVGYLRILHNNRLLAKKKNAPRSAQSGSNRILAIRPGSGTPMAVQHPSSDSSYQWHEQNGYPMSRVAASPEASAMQGFAQFGAVSGPPPFYVPPLQQPLQQYQQQQSLPPPQYFDPMGYEARFDTLPAYEPGSGAPARLAGRPGVYRPTP